MTFVPRHEGLFGHSRFIVTPFCVLSWQSEIDQ